MKLYTMLLHSMEEHAQEVLNLVRDKGFGQWVNDIPLEEVYNLIAYVTRVVVNRHIRTSHPQSTYDQLEAARQRLRNGDPDFNQFVNELVDEIYTTVVSDLVPRLNNEKNLYSVERVGTILRVNLLVSEEALAYLTLDVTDLLALVTIWTTSC